MARLGAVVVGMGLAALLVAYLGLGWPVLLVGVPALVAVGLVVLAVMAWEGPVRRLAEQRVAPLDPDTEVTGGLMSGFFELSAPQLSSERPDSHR